MQLSYGSTVPQKLADTLLKCPVERESDESDESDESQNLMNLSHASSSMHVPPLSAIR